MVSLSAYLQLEGNDLQIVFRGWKYSTDTMLIV